MENRLLYTSECQVNNQIYFCGIPFRLDTYSGCSHECRYCFARTNALTNISKEGRREELLVCDPNNFKHKMTIALDKKDQRSDIVIDWIRHFVPIHFGGMSDPFQPLELSHRASKRCMEILNWYDYPTVISTKGTDVITKPEYIKLLKDGKYIVQFTIIGMEDSVIKQIEPGVPLASKRIEAIETLASAGIHVVVRMQPVFPGTILEKQLPEFISAVAKRGAKHFITEGYKVQVRNKEWKNQLNILFPELLKEYVINNDQFGFETLLPSWRKLKYVEVASKACHENGLTYGAADNDMRLFGDMVCCCGTDNVKGFENTWKYQASQAGFIAKEKGEVSLKDMEQFWDGGNYEIAEQAGAMRDYANNNKLRTTPKFCVEYHWKNGGDCSPGNLVGMKPYVFNEQVVWKYTEQLDKLKGIDIKQSSIFDII